MRAHVWASVRAFVCEKLTHFCMLFSSSSKVRRLELQVYLAPESESLPDPQREEEFADADEGGEDFLGEADFVCVVVKRLETIPPRLHLLFLCISCL